MSKLKELYSLCSVNISIEINPHRAYLMDVKEYINEIDTRDVPEDVLREMVQRDTVITVQAYPNTPMSFVLIHHYDIDAALELAINQIKPVNMVKL